MERTQVFELVRSAVVEVLEDTGLQPEDVRPESSLTADLQMESMRFVDLTVVLEERFALARFPMQDWLDAELAAGDEGFRVNSLVNLCHVLMDGQAWRSA